MPSWEFRLCVVQAKCMLPVNDDRRILIIICSIKSCTSLAIGVLCIIRIMKIVLNTMEYIIYITYIHVQLLSRSPPVTAVPSGLPEPFPGWPSLSPAPASSPHSHHAPQQVPATQRPPSTQQSAGLSKARAHPISPCNYCRRGSDAKDTV